MSRLLFDSPEKLSLSLHIVDTDEDRCPKHLEYDMHEVRLVRPCESQFLGCHVLAYMVYSKTDSLTMQAMCLRVNSFIGYRLMIAVIVTLQQHKTDFLIRDSL